MPGWVKLTFPHTRCAGRRLFNPGGREIFHVMKFNNLSLGVRARLKAQGMRQLVDRPKCVRQPAAPLIGTRCICPATALTLPGEACQIAIADRMLTAIPIAKASV